MGWAGDGHGPATLSALGPATHRASLQPVGGQALALDIKAAAFPNVLVGGTSGASSGKRLRMLTQRDDRVVPDAGVFNTR